MKLLLLVALVGLHSCDLPINCYNSLVAGEWAFRVTKAKPFSNPVDNLCGHKIPDDEKTSYLAKLEKDQVLIEASLVLQLKESGEVTVRNEQVFQEIMVKNRRLKRRAEDQCGVWSMIYNEGFEVRVRGVKLLLFNQYYKENNRWMSNCAKTLLGWYQNGDEYGCVYGQKTDGKDIINEANVEGNIVLQGKIIPRVNDAPIFRFLSKYQKKTQTMTTTSTTEGKKFLAGMKSALQMNSQFKAHQSVVERLNSIEGKGWTARVNKVFENKSIEEVNRLSGRAKKTGTKGGKGRKHPTELSRQSDLVDELFRENPQQQKHFDWSEEIGWMPKARQQKSCGSCYVISTMSMLDFRLKIQEHRQRRKMRLGKKSKKEEEESIGQLSSQFAMDCNYYNQGCQGGYSMLVSKFGQEQFLLEEKHKHYSGRTQDCNKGLKSLDSINHVVRIKDYGYLAQRYGNSNHLNIMKELKTNGPMVLSFSPDDAFSYYSEGIYRPLEAAQWVQQNIQRPEWTNVDHSILVYGWGEEDGMKYWLCQNSWGSEFGMKGSFKILRGEDTLGIESSAEVGEPYLVEASELEFYRSEAQKYKSI